jgi:ketosteroid isomerase-like protein
LVERYFAAMQRGPDGHDELVELFAVDAEYVEPFTGRGPHRGREEIRAFLARSAPYAPADLRVHVERLDIAAGQVTATWRCESPDFSRPSRGQDSFTIRDGRIQRLETILIEPPELRAGRP